MDMMAMGSNLPAWVTPVAWTFLVLALASAGAILVDVYVRGHRQASRAMEFVWPVTALYLGPFALWAYARRGRAATSTTGPARSAGERSGVPAVAFGLPGGAASVLAHIVGVPLVVLTGWTIAGLDMWAMVAVIAVLALALLFGFEYASRGGATAHLGARTARRAAIVAVSTILAFDVGMVGWMVILYLGALMPPASEVSFVFLMQIGVVIGLGTAYPVVRGLARRSSTPAAA